MAQIEVKAEFHVPSPINHWTSAAPERDITLDKAALFSYGMDWAEGEAELQGSLSDSLS